MFGLKAFLSVSGIGEAPNWPIFRSWSVRIPEDIGGVNLDAGPDPRIILWSRRSG